MRAYQETSCAVNQVLMGSRNSFPILIASIPGSQNSLRDASFKPDQTKRSEHVPWDNCAVFYDDLLAFERVCFQVFPPCSLGTLKTVKSILKLWFVTVSIALCNYFMLSCFIWAHLLSLLRQWRRQSFLFFVLFLSSLAVVFFPRSVITVNWFERLHVYRPSQTHWLFWSIMKLRSHQVTTGKNWPCWAERCYSAPRQAVAAF